MQRFPRVPIIYRKSIIDKILSPLHSSPFRGDAGSSFPRHGEVTRYNVWMKASALLQAQVFSGHESFPIRFTWLTKAVRHCEPIQDRDLFSRDDAMVTLGVGKNMVRSMRSWGISTRMLEVEEDGGRISRLRPTALGAMLFGADGLDPFMEDPATVWLVHWSLASNPKLATWFWVFNELREAEFEKGALIKRLQRVSRETSGRNIADDTIERDVECFLKSYVSSAPDKRLSREELLDCPLTEIGLIRRSGTPNTFAFVRGRQQSLPNEVFAYCLLRFWNERPVASGTLRFDEIAFSAGGPGQVFKLTENAIVDRLHALAQLTRNSIRYDDTSGLRQVLRDRDVDAETLLKRYYGHMSKEGRHAGKH